MNKQDEQIMGLVAERNALEERLRHIRNLVTALQVYLFLNETHMMDEHRIIVEGILKWLKNEEQLEAK